MVSPIAVRSQSISGVSAFNPLVAFYDIHGRKGEVLFFCFAPDTPRDTSITLDLIHHQPINVLTAGAQAFHMDYT
jgi:hypothetical protein